MERRKFLLKSGLSVLGSTGIVTSMQKPSVALDFSIKSIKDEDPNNINSIISDFSKFNLTPYYIESDQLAQITVKLTIPDQSQLPQPTSFS